MTDLADLQDTIAGSGRARGPVGRGPRARLGARIGRGDRRRPGAHERAQPAARGGDRHVRRRPRASGSVAGGDADLDLAVLAVDTGDVPRRRAGSPAEAPGIGSAGGGARQPRRARPARHARLRVLGGTQLPRPARPARAAARSSTPPRSRAARRAARSWTPTGNLLGHQRLRLDGGLILAVPASAAVKRARPRPRRAARRPQRHRLGVAIAPPRVARRMRQRRRPARARRPAGARGRGRQPRRAARASSAAT